MSEAPREGDQPPPTTNDHPPIQPMVIEDIKERVADDMGVRMTIGLQRYGTLLQPHNGRDMLRDLYEELMDACIYVRGAIYERDGQ